MKKLFAFVVCLMFICVAFAQVKMSKVVLKNGVTVTGSIKEFNPTSHITLSVAGFDTRIEMSDISSIEEVTASSGVMAEQEQTDEDFIQVDNEDYPEFLDLKVGPYTIEMVLVKGGDFLMGYDGQGSRSLYSEPVHEVRLSSFYINRSPINKEVVAFLKKGTEKQSDKASYFTSLSWKEANSIADSLAKHVGLPIHLFTEAQCEYIITSGFVKQLQLKYLEEVFCFDLYETYRRTLKPQIDPKGAATGNNHVKRYLNASGTEIYRRLTENTLSPKTIRVSFPAAALHQ